MLELNGAPAGAADLQALGLTNFGHYTSIRVDDGAVRGLTHHLNRLVRDSRAVFGADLDPADVLAHAERAATHQDRHFGLRITIFDPDLPLARPADAGKPSILVTTRPTAALPAPPLRVGTSAYVRDMPAVKHTGLFGALAQRREAQLRGFDDVLFLDEDGHLSEGATWNIGFFDGHSVIWPDAEMLTGVTMTLLRQVHEETLVQPLRWADLANMEAAFATNTTVGVRPISLVEDAVFPNDHHIIRTLQREYAEIPPELLVSSP